MRLSSIRLDVIVLSSWVLAYSAVYIMFYIHWYYAIDLIKEPDIYICIAFYSIHMTQLEKAIMAKFSLFYQ